MNGISVSNQRSSEVSHSTIGDGWSAAVRQPGGRTEHRARHLRRQSPRQSQGPQGWEAFSPLRRTRAHTLSALISTSPLTGCAWFRGWRAAAGQCGTRCAMAIRVETRPAATASALVLPSNVPLHVVQRPRLRSLPAQFASLVRPLCPLSALNYHRHIVSGGIHHFGGGSGAQSRRFWPLLASWQPRLIPAHQLIPMSPPFRHTSEMRASRAPPARSARVLKT